MFESDERDDNNSNNFKTESKRRKSVIFAGEHFEKLKK